MGVLVFFLCTWVKYDKLKTDCSICLEYNTEQVLQSYWFTCWEEELCLFYLWCLSCCVGETGSSRKDCSVVGVMCVFRCFTQYENRQFDTRVRWYDVSVSEHDEPLTDVSKHTKTGTDGGKYLLMLLIAIIIIRRVIIYFCFYLWSISICYRAALFQGRD